MRTAHAKVVVDVDGVGAGLGAGGLVQLQRADGARGRAAHRHENLVRRRAQLRRALVKSP
eukprot:5802786-Pleurochrysis_carterae.AAC.1